MKISLTRHSDRLDFDCGDQGKNEEVEWLRWKKGRMRDTKIVSAISHHLRPWKNDRRGEDCDGKYSQKNEWRNKIQSFLHCHSSGGKWLDLFLLKIFSFFTGDPNMQFCTKSSFITKRGNRPKNYSEPGIKSRRIIAPNGTPPSG